MNIESYETAISSWNSLLTNRFFDLARSKFILYMNSDGIRAGWTYDYQIPHLNDICTYLFVDKESISTMSENEYNDLVEALKFKDKQKKYRKKLKELHEDFE